MKKVPTGSLDTPFTVVAARIAKWLDIYSGVLMIRVLLSWFPNIPWDRQPLSAIRKNRQPEIHLFAARFREKNGDIYGARAAYQLMHTRISPGLLEAIIKHANMEHRLEDACSLYEQAIAIEKGKEHSQTLPLLFAQYSRFIFLIPIHGGLKSSFDVNFNNVDKVVRNFCNGIFRSCSMG